jgi:hypothetical protein
MQRTEPNYLMAHEGSLGKLQFYPPEVLAFQFRFRYEYSLISDSLFKWATTALQASQEGMCAMDFAFKGILLAYRLHGLGSDRSSFPDCLIVF